MSTYPFDQAWDKERSRLGGLEQKLRTRQSHVCDGARERRFRQCCVVVWIDTHGAMLLLRVSRP